MGRRNRRDNKAAKIALGGVFAALGIIIMLMGGIIPVATFTAPALAGLCLLPICMEASPKYAWLTYAVVSILSLLMVADKELVFFYIFLLGYYPILHPTLSKIKHKLPQYLLKLLLFNLAIVAVYLLLLFVLVDVGVQQEFSEAAWWFTAGMLLIGNVTFVLYDTLLTKLRLVYICRWKGRFFR